MATQASKSSREKSSRSGEKDDKSKTHKLSLKGKHPSTIPKRTNLTYAGSSKMVSEFFEYSINTILYQRGVYPIEDFSAVKKYGLNMLVTSDDQVKAYIKKIMGQLNKWMLGQKISKLVIVITSKETGDHIERWQFDVQINKSSSSSKSKSKAGDKENAAPE
jgi:mitotic spindle assembly checkpoint protein MAD2